MRRFGVAMSIVGGLGLWLASPAYAQTYPVIPPAISCPSVATVGAAIQVSGTNWLPGSNVRLTFDSAPVLGTAPVDADGTFETTVQIPSDATVGAHAITAEGKDQNGEPFATSCPISLVGAEVPGEVAITGTNISLGLVILAILITAGLGFLVASRRKKVNTDSR